MLRFIDLFCGIGGFRKALEDDSTICVFSSEIEKSTRKAYEINFGEIPAGDITEISASDIPAHDILCAGFPCQSFSISGKKLGLKDKGGSLFNEIVRIANHHKPSLLLLENVSNIVNIDSGKTIVFIQKQLEYIGYTTDLHVLNASFFGIPQARKRAYFVCLRKDSHIAHNKRKELLPSQKKIFLDEILDEEVDENLFVKNKVVTITKISNKRQLKPVRIGFINHGRQGERIYSTYGHSITLSAFGGGIGANTGLYLVNKKVRRLSLNECKRLMCFPQKHFISDGKKGYNQLGNAVIPTMAKMVFESINWQH